MGETCIRIIIFVALVLLVIWYSNKWFKKKQSLVVGRTRSKWRRLCKETSFDGRSIASQRLDSRNLFKLVRIISIPIGVLLAAYISNFAFNLPSSEPEQWGQMGDFFGGMLNPILACASFIALLYTIRIQSEELRLTREEFAKSSKAQEDIANTAKEELEVAKASYQSQKDLQFALPFFDICQKRIANCESVLGKKAVVPHYGHDPEEKSWLEFVAAKAYKKIPSDYKSQLSSLTMANHDKMFIAESLKILGFVSDDFQDAWNAIANVDGMMKSPDLEQMKSRMIGLVLTRLAKVAYILHITGVREFQEVQDNWCMQNDYLMDEFRTQLKRIYDTA